MQQVATIESVRQAMRRLEAEGQRITGRAVLALTGGSKGTVLSLIREIRDQAVPALEEGIEISDSLKLGLAREMSAVVQAAREQMSTEIDQAKSDAAEALESLVSAEARIEQLVAELEELRADSLQRQAEAEKAEALAEEKLAAYRGRVAELETERKQLIEAGETARTELAKAQLQIERADRAAQKAEERVEKLSLALEKEQNRSVVAEKNAAVSAQRAEDLEQQLARIPELETERKQLVAAGETARTELAKAQMQVERAENAAQKTEVEIGKLSLALEAEKSRAMAAERDAAVNSRQLADLRERLEKIENRLEKEVGLKEAATERVVQLEKNFALAGKTIEDQGTVIEKLRAEKDSLGNKLRGKEK